MRLLIACPKCKRQYDATGRPVGGHFHCVCGEALTVARPAGHDSDVVRCSSCGAPRQGDQQRCGFCGADFTLHEQDLDTICPNCFARQSDRAKFCDHCGHALAAHALPVDDTPLVCPSCQGDHRLSNRQVVGYAVLECKVCGGFWVDNDVLDHLIDRAAKSAVPSDLRGRENVGGKQAISLDGLQVGSKPHGYLPCPLCHDRMLHENFGHSSGVVIDVCKRDGVWFDSNKLPRLLDWARTGGRPEAPKSLDPFERAKAAELEVRMSNGQCPADGEVQSIARTVSKWNWIDRLLLDLFS